MADNTPTERKEQFEVAISRYRAETMKDLIDNEEAYISSRRAWLSTFDILDAINQPDHQGRAQFEATLAQDQIRMKAARDAVVVALDAMEADMRLAYETYEQRVREHGELSPSTVILNSFCVLDYFKDNAPPGWM